MHTGVGVFQRPQKRKPDRSDCTCKTRPRQTFLFYTHTRVRTQTPCCPTNQSPVRGGRGFVAALCEAKEHLAVHLAVNINDSSVCVRVHMRMCTQLQLALSCARRPLCLFYFFPVQVHEASDPHSLNPTSRRRSQMPAACFSLICQGSGQSQVRARPGARLRCEIRGGGGAERGCGEEEGDSTVQLR